MPKAPQNRIGEVHGRWRIIKENQRGIAMDHGKHRAKIRNFMVECTQCGYIKESVTYKNIYYDKISHGCKTDYQKQFETILNGKYGYNIVNKIVTNVYNIRYMVMGVRIPKPGEYKFKTLLYKLKCDNCGAKKEILHQQVANQDFNFCKCKNHLPKEEPKTREDIIKDIEFEFNWMLELNKEGQLINYLKNKFPDEKWDEILEEEY